MPRPTEPRLYRIDWQYVAHLMTNTDKEAFNDFREAHRQALLDLGNQSQSLAARLEETGLEEAATKLAHDAEAAVRSLEANLPILRRRFGASPSGRFPTDIQTKPKPSWRA